MGFFSEEMAPMLGTYESETMELLANFNEAVADVEKNDAFDPESIATLFRCSHTTKSSSAMMGLEGLATLTHSVEDLFDLLRADPSLAEGHVADFVDDLYTFSDFVKDELVRMDDEDFQPRDTAALADKFRANAAMLLGAERGTAQPATREGATATAPVDPTGTAAPADTAASADKVTLEASAAASPGNVAASSGSVAATQASPQAAAADKTADEVAVKVVFKSNVAMANARAMVIVRQLNARKLVISHVPGDLMSPKAGPEILSEGLLLTVARPNVSEVQKLLAKNSNVQRVKVLSSTAASSPQQQAQAGPSEAAAPDKYVTLRWDSISNLQDLAGDFILELTRMKKASAGAPEESGMRTIVSQMSRLVDELVYSVNGMAMVSVAALVPQLSRMVRDMCRQSGKRVSFKVHGGNIEVDRNLYNSISEPLLHIIRNAVDHGIEPADERTAAGKDTRGTVTLEVESLGGRVVFRVSDDGAGIDDAKLLAKAEAKGLLDKPASMYSHDEALQLIMKPGFSTAQNVTQYSGRGVGMDVVNTVVRDFDGRVEVKSALGKGTSISLFMPVSVTAVQSLAFRIGPFTCYMPLLNLDTIVSADEARPLLSVYEDMTLLQYKKQDIPVLNMREVLGCSSQAAPGAPEAKTLSDAEDGFFVVCHNFDTLYAIYLDDVIGEATCTTKNLPGCLDKQWQVACGIRNAVIRSDGTVGYVLNAAALADLVHREDKPEVADTSTKRWLGTILNETDDNFVPERVFVFELGGGRYALDVNAIERILPFESYTPVPHTFADMQGLTSYHNHVVPVFDMVPPDGELASPSYVLIVSGQKEQPVGLTITNAVGVRETKYATPLEDQPEPEHFVGGLHSATTMLFGARDVPVTILH